MNKSFQLGNRLQREPSMSTILIYRRKQLKYYKVHILHPVALSQMLEALPNLVDLYLQLL